LFCLGLVENESFVHSAFLQKNQVKRCSLVSGLGAQQAKAETVRAEPGEDQLRKQYIRSLSLARDPGAEPLFLAAKLKAAVDRQHLAASSLHSFD